MSKEVLLEKLTDTTYRNAFISEEIDIGLPMQIRAIREARGWNQKYVAAQMETKQPRFSLMEKPGYGNFSLSTLKRLANIFNVGLIVSFVPFSEMIDFTESLSRKRLAIPSFAEEYEKLARRYGRGHAEGETTQGSFDFTASTAEMPQPDTCTSGAAVVLSEKTLSEFDDLPTNAARLYRSAAAGAML
jgi:transcriptional regulator with XRE-family HTH domain